MADAATSTETQTTTTQTGDAGATAGADAAKAAETATGTTTETTTTTETKAEEYTLAPIEGGVLDEAGVAQVQTIAKDLGLGKEAAEKLLAAQDATLRAFQDGQITAYQAKQQEWEAAAKADPEIGGGKAEITDARLAAVLKRFDADGAFKKELDDTGFGKHPIVRRLFARIGAAMSEDSGAGGADGGTPATPPKSVADRIHGPAK
jgi:hypothetical protein